jgi:hypothetical protein
VSRNDIHCLNNIGTDLDGVDCGTVYIGLIPVVSSGTVSGRSDADVEEGY